VTSACEPGSAQYADALAPRAGPCRPTGPPPGRHALGFDRNSKALCTVPRISEPTHSHPYHGEQPVLRVEFEREDDIFADLEQALEAA
jgi:hypothetical protein